MAESAIGYRPFPAFSEWVLRQIDETTYESFARLLSRAKDAAVPADLAAAVRTATRFAAVDTGAIEGLYDVDRGFTRTVATEAATWEAVANARGEHVVRAIEDALEAYEYVLDLATRRERLTEAVIRELHALACRSQQTYDVYTSQGLQQQALPLGEYKQHPNSPMNLSTGRMHHYAPVIDTSAEMHRLVEELESSDFQAAHPILQASYAHYAFVCIHPFADGNGRVSRALASIYLYRSPGIPLVIFADQKEAYFDTLEAADRGQFDNFISFVLERVLDTIELVRAFLRSAADPSLTETAAAYRRHQLGRQGLPHEDMDALNVRLLGLVEHDLSRQLAEDDLGGMKFAVSSSSGGQPAPPTGYRARPYGQNSLTLTLSSGPPANVGLSLTFATFVANNSHDGPDLIAVETGHPEDPLEVFLRDIDPSVTHVLELKVAAWVQGHIRRLARLVVDEWTETSRKLGYIN